MTVATSISANTVTTGDFRSFLASRGINPQTILAFGVKSDTDYFPELGRQTASIRFPYKFGYKARSVEEKAFIAGDGFKSTFFNGDRVEKAIPDTLYVCEGELDCMSLVEAGIQVNQVVSVPTGARAEPTDNPWDAKAYEYVIRALERGLGKVGKIVWCGDSDQPGLALRLDMARIFGEAKFNFVEWPEGIKDANDMLVKHGARALKNIVTEGVKVWPIDGIYSLDDLPEPPKLVLWDAGFNWGKKIQLAQRTLSVFTGKPGMGKTATVAQIYYSIARRYMVPMCIATFETRAKPHYRRILRQLHARKLEQFMDDEELKEADSWINDWYRFLVHKDEQPTLQWLLEKAEAAVIRHGARVIVIDPWNRLDHMRDRTETETLYIGKCLRELHCFAHDMNCRVEIVAHPTKLEAIRRDRAPDLEDISGCYSDDTEVLTKRGWLRHSEIELTDKVACFDLELHQLKWENPTDIWKYHYTGDMHRHRYRGGDLLVTPNHRMVVKPSWRKPKHDDHHNLKFQHDKWQFVESRDLSGGMFTVPQSALWQDNTGVDTVTQTLDGGWYVPDSFWEFVGWWIAEGWESQKGIAICQADKDADRIKYLIWELGLDVYDDVEGRDDTETTELPVWKARVRKRSHPELCEWIIENCGIGCQNKRIPKAAWDLPRYLKLALFDGLMAGDGNATRSGWAYTTTSDGLADDVQRLAIELGYTAMKRKELPPPMEHHKDRYTVNISGRAQSSLLTGRHTTWEPYDGLVWCLTVPTGAYVTRRNGWASICGNSMNWYNMVDQGFCIHREKQFEGIDRKTEATLYHLKARFSELGWPCEVKMNFDLSTESYVSMEG